MVPALLMFAAASVGFGGHPWIAFAGGTFLMIASSAPEKVQQQAAAGALRLVWRHPARAADRRRPEKPRLAAGLELFTL
jgi:hypothetical protein